MDKAIMTEVDNLRRASVTSLQKRYRELFQQEARSRHREHLFRKIVWRLQALAEGQLSERARARAREIANDADLHFWAQRQPYCVLGQVPQHVGFSRSLTRKGTNGHAQKDQVISGKSNRNVSSIELFLDA